MLVRCGRCYRRDADDGDRGRSPDHPISRRHRAPPTAKDLVRAITPQCPIGRPCSSDTKPGEISPKRTPLERAAVVFPNLGGTRQSGWSSPASDTRTGGESPTRTPLEHACGRPCRRPHSGSRPCSPPRGEAAVTAQPLTPVIPSSGVSATRQRARSAAGPAAAAGPPRTRAAGTRGRDLRDRPHRRLRADLRPSRHQRTGLARR